jgi:hypothetical protein
LAILSCAVTRPINAARGQLPANLPTNPNWRKVNPAESEILDLALTSATKTQPQLYDVAESILAQKIQQIAGIGQVNLGGSSRPGVRAEVNPMQLSKLGVGLDQVATALNSANAHSPKGQLTNPADNYILNDNDQLFVAKDYAPLIVAYNNGAPVRLSDVAKVVDSQENIRNAGSVNGEHSVILELFRQPQGISQRQWITQQDDFHPLGNPGQDRRLHIHHRAHAKGCPVMLVEGHAVKPQFLAQHLLVQVLVIEFAPPGRIEIGIGRSEKSPSYNLLIGEITIWAFSEIT